MNLEHTETPWRAVNVAGAGWQIEWATGCPIAHLRWTDGMRPEVEARVAADAYFIAKAANSHEALVKALEALEPFLDTEGQMLDDASLNDGRATAFGSASMQARRALRAAKGEA